VYALNLTHSPEKYVFWDRADSILLDAGETEGTLETRTNRHPGVADSIELDNDDGVTRRASENNPKVLGESIPDREDSNRVWLTNVKGGGQKTPMRGMETSKTAMV